MERKDFEQLKDTIVREIYETPTCSICRFSVCNVLDGSNGYFDPGGDSGSGGGDGGDGGFDW